MKLIYGITDVKRKGKPGKAGKVGQENTFIFLYFPKENSFVMLDSLLLFVLL